MKANEIEWKSMAGIVNFDTLCVAHLSALKPALMNWNL